MSKRPVPTVRRPPSPMSRRLKRRGAVVHAASLVQSMEQRAERPSGRGTWTRHEWLSECRGQSRVYGDHPALAKRAHFDTIYREFRDCATKVKVLVCPRCREIQSESGDLTSGSHGLCPLPGCPVLDAEDRAHRASVLQGAIDDIRMRAATEVKKIASYVRMMERNRDPRRSKGRKVLAARKGAVAQLSRSAWFGFEIARSYDPAEQPECLLKRFMNTAKAYNAFVRRLWSETVSGDGTEGDVSALGAWIQQPSEGRLTLRVAYFGLEVTPTELEAAIQRECPHAEVAWAHAIDPGRSIAWACVFAADDSFGPRASTFTADWLLGQPRTAISPDLALLWTAAIARAGLNGTSWSDGLLREHYLPLLDPTRERRANAGRCACCGVKVKFREIVMETERYLRARRFRGELAFAERELPRTQEPGSSESESEARSASSETQDSESE